MSSYMEITLGGHTFKVSYFEFEQSIEIREPLKEMASGDLVKQVKAASFIVSLAISEYHADMTHEKVAKLRGPIATLFETVNKILEFNGYDVSGKATAAAETA